MSFTEEPLLAVDSASTLVTLDNSHPSIAYRTSLILRRLVVYFDLAFHLQVRKRRPLSRLKRFFMEPDGLTAPLQM
jgi:hypothetical protein